jgi:hypothetical protein
VESSSEYKPTGIPVLDNIEETFQRGSDDEFLAAVKDFIDISKRLPKTSLMSWKYVERIHSIAEEATFRLDSLDK